MFFEHHSYEISLVWSYNLFILMSFQNQDRAALNPQHFDTQHPSNIFFIRKSPLWQHVVFVIIM